MLFEIISRGQSFPSEGRDRAYLRVDHWNDFSFVTMFDVMIFDESGEGHEIGAVKIGFFGQVTSISTYSTLAPSFSELSDQYFSVGQDVAYYSRLINDVPEGARSAFLSGLRDIVFGDGPPEVVQREEVFRTSLLRNVSLSAIEGQFRRVLSGGIPLTDYDFDFSLPQSDSVAGIDLKFSVGAGSVPSTNIHSVIGRNGVGNQPSKRNDFCNHAA